MRAIPEVCAVVLMVVACGVAAPAPGDTDPPGMADTAMRPTTAWRQDVLVRLDGVPVAGAIVLQGGAPGHVRTAEDGTAVVEVDPAIPGDLVVVAAHPEARSVGEDVLRPGPRVALDLVRFDRSDDPAYVFQDPGTPERDAGTDTCAHCHVRQVADWVDSVHARAASNPVVHDVYAGTARHDEAPCMAAGGSWVEGPLPGGGSGLRCRLGVGVLPDLDPACDPGPCTTPTSTGGCADCHAPALDGVLGGRDLLEARGIAFDHGIHCDLCHKVAAVHLERPAGVGGRLEVVRPSEPATLAGLDRAPLTFGPYPDVLNPRMGAVVSPLLQEATFCAGCHELEQAALLPGADVDRGRWPTGRFPVQSTFSEWSAGPLAGVAPCQSCHMPPDPAAGNVADLDLLGGVGVGIASGWWRPPGSARRHTWDGPRRPGSAMLRLAASVDLVTAVEADQLVVQATVRNTGPGHAIPTGEPLRALVLTVEASCPGGPLVVVGGDALPASGGWLARREAGQDWSRWPEARPRQVIRVVREEGWVDYVGPGPFGDGTFDAPAKGLPRWVVVGQSEVRSVLPGGEVVLDAPLPVGDVALLGEPPTSETGQEARALAGAAGAAFARVLVDPEGRTQVPHHRAVDVQSDNRLMPGRAWTSTHRFADACADPQVRARLTWRAYPVALARERSWVNPDLLVAEVVR